MSMPAFAPLFQPFPWVCKGVRVVSITVECDRAALVSAVPGELEVNARGLAFINVIEYGVIAGANPYHEFVMTVPCHLGQQQRGVYCLWIYVDSDNAMAGGREVFGVPKKMAAIDLGWHGDQIVATATRSGVTFATVGMTLDTECASDYLPKVAKGFGTPMWGLREFPGHEGTTAVRELVEASASAEVHRAIKGRAFVDFRPSAADPLHLFAPRAIEGLYYELDLVMRTPHPPAGSHG